MGKKMSREEIRRSVFDERNILNCIKCPYNIGDEKLDTNRILYPCNNSICLLGIARYDETYFY